MTTDRKFCVACQHYDGKYGHGRNALVGTCLTGGAWPERTAQMTNHIDRSIWAGTTAKASCPRWAAMEQAA
jgi:hypothetical protein